MVLLEALLRKEKKKISDKKITLRLTKIAVDPFDASKQSYMDRNLNEAQRHLNQRSDK